MVNITEFKLRGNRIDFKIDDKKFTVKYPEEYNLGREYLDLAKESALSLWANKVAFVRPEKCHIDFAVSQDRIRFWLWVANKVNQLDVYQSLSDDFDSDEIPYTDLTKSVEVTTGDDTNSLISTPELDPGPLSGAIISQSPGKESVASKLICDEVGVSPVYSAFIEYSSRASTHKIAGRKEYTDYFDNPTIRIWSNFNELQSILQDYTENYEPITCFWEMLYLTAELPLAAYHGCKYILIGNQLNTGEAMIDPKGRFTTFEELNQSYVFEVAYTNYLREMLDSQITHTSNVRPFTGYSCRKIIADREPEFLKHMQNCLRPNSKRRWCLKCYKCNNSWVEFLGCGFNPEEAGLDHDVLIENPHFAADNEDWGFSFPRYARDEQVWRDDVDTQWFESEIYSNFTEEQKEAFSEWRRRQEERVDEDEVEHLRAHNGQFIEPVTSVIPDETLSDMGLPHTDYVPEALDVRRYRQYALEWALQ